MKEAFRAIVIDDDPDIAALLRQYLQQEWPQATIEHYDPLVELLPDASFPLGSFDLVILDYMLGRGDGLEWLAALKARPDCPKILFLTGAGSEAVAVRAMKEGADDYVRKQDLTRDKLVSSVRELLLGSDETLTPSMAGRLMGHGIGAELRIPGIKVLRLIGEGGAARVYLASRIGDDEPLVVKVLRAEMTDDPRSLARFMEECSLTMRINSRRVARIHDLGKSGEHTYLVMEFFEGGDLHKRIAGKPLKPDESLRLFAELMLGLKDVHEKSIVHRDLKPQNLMFRADGSLAIADFGIAKSANGIDLTTQDESIGTPRYMSPEQIEGKPIDARTDLYSSGVLLYEMLTGEHLFGGDTTVEVALKHLKQPPPPLPADLATYQPLLDRLLAKNREERFANAGEALAFLSGTLSRSPRA